MQCRLFEGERGSRPSSARPEVLAFLHTGITNAGSDAFQRSAAAATRYDSERSDPPPQTTVRDAN
jgi:hypothetical protein